MKLLILITLGLMGCVSSPINATFYSATCSGFKGWESCMQQALKDCPKGFNVQNREESQITQLRYIKYSCKN